MEQGATKGRRERDRLRQRREILDAAVKVVEARGLEGLTVGEVAREAEFAVGSIYRHFRSKEELLEVLVVHLAEPMCEELEALAGEGWAEDRLQTVIRTMLDHFSEQMPLIRAYHVVAGPLPSEGSPSRMHLEATRRRWIAALARILADGQARGALRAGDPGEWAALVLGLVSGWARWTAFGSGPEVVREPAAAICGLVLDGIRG